SRHRTLGKPPPCAGSFVALAEVYVAASHFQRYCDGSRIEDPQLSHWFSQNSFHAGRRAWRSIHTARWLLCCQCIHFSFKESNPSEIAVAARLTLRYLHGYLLCSSGAGCPGSFIWGGYRAE